jgi:hypothetical protein
MKWYIQSWRYHNTIRIANNQLKGRNKETPTWLKFHSCRKGLRGLLNP